MRRTATLLAFAAALLAALIVSAGGGRAAAQEADGCFEPRPLPGLTLAAFADGGLDRLEHCAAAFGVRVHAAADDGWLTLDPASDADAKAPFRARYADGAAAGTPFLLEQRTPFGLLAHEPDAFEGYTLLQNGPVHYLIDIRGRIVHEWNLGWPHRADLLENGHLLGFVRGRLLREADPDGNVVWEYDVPGRGRPHHDFVQLPGGNHLLLVLRTASPEEAVAAGADPALVPANGLNYETLVEVRPIRPAGGEIVWEWSLWDHLIQDFDPARDNYGVVADHPELVDLNFLLAKTRDAGKHGTPRDWIHANSIDYHPELDQIVISARNFSELWIVDHSTTTEEAAGHAGGRSGKGGDLLYRWGNPLAYRAGAAGDQQLFWPHDIHWIAPGLPGAGNILAFNNGDEFRGYERGWSSVVEIALPEDGYGYRPSDPAPVWTYEADPPEAFYAQRTSGAQRLPNGNTLICDGPRATIFEVTPDGRTVWKYVSAQYTEWCIEGDCPSSSGYPARMRQGRLAIVENTDPLRLNTSMYRATRYAPDYPGLRSLDLTPKGTIEIYGEP